MVSSVYAPFKQRLLEVLDSHLECGAERDMTLENFLKKRIKIKSLHHTIVPLVPKKVQLLHQKAKEQAAREGKKARFLLLKSRRMGMTTWEQALSYRAATTFANTTCVTLADTKENTKTIFRMVNLMAKMDPMLRHRTNDSKVSLEIPSLNSYFHIGTAGSRSFSRGDNIYRAHGSEVAWWSGDYETIDNLVAGISEAARHGEVIFETTANGASGWYYEKYKEAMAGENAWIPLFYPWFLDPENVINPTQTQLEEWLDTVTEHEREVMVKHDLTTEQMMWRRDKQRELKKLFTQEYPEHWTEAFLVRGNSFFDQGMLAEITEHVAQPISQRDTLTVWKEPIEGHDYLAGGDTAEGNADSDNSICAILDKATGEQVAVLRGKWRPEVFARKAIELCKRYNNAMFACEVNNHGHSVLNTVLNTLRYRHIYYYEKPLEKNKYGRGKKEKKPGWLTSSKTRPILLDELNEALEEGYMVVNDLIFLAECKTFVDNGGKFEADKGQHDDSIMAWGIAWQARKQLKRRFNIV
jgi:hypothetical protein